MEKRNRLILGALTLVIAIGGYWFATSSKDSAQPIQPNQPTKVASKLNPQSQQFVAKNAIQQAELGKIQDKNYLLLVYSATQCAPCDSYIPELVKYETSPNPLPLYRINLDEVDKRTLAMVLVPKETEPTVIQYREGKELTRFIGVVPVTMLPKRS